MREDDFVDMMREVIPRLIDHATQDTTMSTEPSSSSTKRSHESDPETISQAKAKPRTAGYDECLSVEDITELHDGLNDLSTSFDVLLVNYLQKKASKELSPCKNDPDLQAQIDESKKLEWKTIVEKQAVRIHYGKKAKTIVEKHQDRFIGSRFVITRKAMEENQAIVDSDPSTYRVKSRWCLQGHLDPDLDRKVEDGLLQSPTLSQMGRMLVMQLIASFGWELQLGDIKGAFLEAGPLPEKFRPLSQTTEWRYPRCSK